MRNSIWSGIALALLLGSCAHVPETKKPQYTQRHYTYSVLLYPEKPITSPKIDVGISMMHMEFPAEQAHYFNSFLYPEPTFDAYKDRILGEQREYYRGRVLELMDTDEENLLSNNWRYSESIDIRNQGQGVIVERCFDTYSGGAHGMVTKRYHVLDLEGQRELKIDDLFADYQEKTELRDIVYEELRRYSKLESMQPLSEGIYFSDEPELSFNFFITDEGLGLHWDPYQIAPYVQGAIEIIIPWRDIRSMMLYSGIEMLAVFNIHLFV